MNEKAEKIGLAILAGGKASRMSFKLKSDLKLGESTFLELLLQEFSMFSEKLISVAKSGQVNLKENHVNSYQLVPDLIEGIGPMGGIYSVLKYCQSDALFIVACDMPFVTKRSYELLKEKIKVSDVSIIKTERGLQPLCGIYKKSCISVIKKCIDQGDFRIKNFLSMIDYHAVYLNDVRETINVNTPEDFHKAIKLYHLY